MTPPINDNPRANDNIQPFDPTPLLAAFQQFNEYCLRLTATLVDVFNSAATNILSQFDWSQMERAMNDVRAILESGGRDPRAWRSIKRKRVRRAQWKKRR